MRRLARSPSEADGSIPSDPAITAASSDRMSPNRFSVTRTSKSAGRRPAASRTSRRAGARAPRPGSRRGPPRSTLRHSRDVARTFALSTWSTLPRRPRASSNASATIAADLAPPCTSRVSIAAPAARPVWRCSRRLAEVEAAGQLADDQQVDALEQLRLAAARRRRAAGWTVIGRRFANSPRPPRSANSACSGRTVASGSSHFGPPTAPSSTASASRHASTSSGRMATPYASIAAPPTTSSVHSKPNPNRGPTASRTWTAPGDDLRPDPVARDRRDPVGRRSRRRAAGAAAPLRHGSSSAVRRPTNATSTPLISAPWSLLIATR